MKIKTVGTALEKIHVLDTSVLLSHPNAFFLLRTTMGRFQTGRHRWQPKRSRRDLAFGRLADICISRNHFNMHVCREEAVNGFISLQV
ncbi:MAG: hypothetical protein NUV45_09865 [Tepidanaerobacteraceae bacterium]|nr:hypothetical protein [Tepidanaerobacteraceae bacterium]